MARADRRCRAVLATIIDQLRATRWLSDDWLPRHLQQARRQFEEALTRWRDLLPLSGGVAQAAVRDCANDQLAAGERAGQGQRLHEEAIRQASLLLDVKSAARCTNLYGYRYSPARASCRATTSRACPVGVQSGRPPPQQEGQGRFRSRDRASWRSPSSRRGR